MTRRPIRWTGSPLLFLLVPLTLACDDSTGPDLTDPGLVRQVSAGAAHTCAVAGDGALYCWGWGIWGQLGDGGTEDRLEPVEVAISSDVVSVSAGYGHTCAVTETGEAYCWGQNYGMLGDGAMEEQHAPTRVLSELRFTSVHAGGVHSCGLTEDGAAYCWGDNRSGQLGDGSTETRYRPVAVATAARFEQLSVGGLAAHTCGVTPEGRALCWGLNDVGQIGDGTAGTDRLEPVPVAGDARYRSIHVGERFTCAVTVDGEAHCWGGNSRGQLGDGSTEDRAEPGPVSGAHGFESVATSGHVCGIAETGVAYCWGDNGRGQLGNGTLDSAAEPVPVATTERFARVTVGVSHSCAVTPGGVLYCWGSNQVGQLGDGGVSLGWRTPVAVWRW